MSSNGDKPKTNSIFDSPWFWRIISVIFGLVTVTAFALALWDMSRSSDESQRQLLKRFDAQTERLVAVNDALEQSVAALNRDGEQRFNALSAQMEQNAQQTLAAIARQQQQAQTIAPTSFTSMWNR